MAGHSKWANIKFRKAQQDAKKGKQFTKLLREITVSARQGGGEPENNPRLRTAIAKAYAQNMSKENIQRAIARATEGSDAANLEACRFEGFGPGNSAFIVECLTDNKNRTVAEVRNAFTKSGGNMAQTGSVEYLFKYVGLIVLSYDSDNPTFDRETTLLAWMDIEGIENIDDETTGIFLIETLPTKLYTVSQSLLPCEGCTIEEASMAWLPQVKERYAPEIEEKIFKLVERLENNDDVQQVYHNAALEE